MKDDCCEAIVELITNLKEEEAILVSRNADGKLFWYPPSMLKDNLTLIALRAMQYGCQHIDIVFREENENGR